MRRNVRYANTPFWAILLIFASTFLNLFTSAVPVNNDFSLSTVIEGDPITQDREALFRWFQAHPTLSNQTHLDKRDKDRIASIDRTANYYAWKIPAEPATYAYGSYYTDPRVQYGSVVLGKKLAQGGQGAIYDATLRTFNIPEQLIDSSGVDDPCVDFREWSHVVTKIAKGKHSWIGAKIIGLIDDDRHIPHVYENLWLSAKESSFVVMEKLARDAMQMLGDYNTHPFDRRELFIQAARGLLAGHKKKFIHLDVKLPNLMAAWTDTLSKRSNRGLTWKVIDWDFAIPVELYKELNIPFPAWVGNKQYRSPG